MLLLSSCGGAGETPPTPPQGATLTAYCSRVVDGDTIEVLAVAGVERVRLIGVDAPELATGQCYALAAALSLDGRLAGTWVELEFEGQQPARDAYGRLLAYVYDRGGTLVNLDLLRTGMVRAYTRYPFRREGEFHAAEATAVVSRAGLWGACGQM